MPEPVILTIRDGNHPIEHFVRFLTEHGVRLLLDVRGVADEAGDVVHIDCVVSDVTDLQEARRARQESEERFRSLVSNFPGAVIRVMPDEERTVDFMSDAIESITGYPASHFVGRPISTYLDIVHPEDRDELARRARQVLEERQPYVLEYRVVHRNGGIRVLRGRGQGVYDDAGRLRYNDAVIFDNTEQHDAIRARLEAEAKYRILAENASDIIWQMDASGVFTYVSPAVRHYGYEPQEWIGHELLPFLPPEERDIYVQRLSQDKRDPGPRRYEVQMLRKNGERVWMEVIVNFVTEDGVVKVVQGIARDITDRKSAEIALLESETALRAFIDDIRHPAGLVHPSGACILANEPLAARFGMTTEEFCRCNFWDLHAPELAKARRAHVDEVVRTGRPAEFEDELDGRWFRHFLAPARDTTGQVTRVAWIALDITDRRLAEEQIRQAHADLQKAYQVQREFINSVTHEIRTPMTAVKGYVEMLLEGIAGPLNEGQIALLQKVLAGSDNLIELVSSLLEVVRLKSGNVVLRPKACKPGAIVEKAIAAVLPQAVKKGLVIDLHAIGQDRMGFYDEEKLVVILNNLLSNAVKFTMLGRIDVFVKSNSTGTEIIVSDTGMGIRQRDLGSIFDQFQQLDYPSRHKPAGFGLGLSIVVSMVTVLGATLVVSSRKGVGTAFTLRVPRMEAGSS